MPGPPAEIYEEPRSPVVASFVGTSILFDEAESKDLLGMPGLNSIRPEKISLGAKGAGLSLPATITEVIYLGTSTRLLVELPSGKRLTVLEQNATKHSTDDRRGETTHASFAKADVVSLHTT